MNPKSHHYNPQVYLRQFMNPKAKNELWEYDIKRGTAILSTPKKSGCEDFYHSITTNDGKRDDTTIENSFRTIENNLRSLFKLVRNQEPLTENAWLTLFQFVALQRARAPVALHSLRKGMSKIHQFVFDHLKQTKRFAESLEKQGVDPTSVRNTDYEVTATRDSVLLSLLQAYSDGAMVNLFNRMKWTFFVAPPGEYFWTSDNPVCCWAKRNPKVALQLPVGPATCDEMTFPISRRTCAIATWKDTATNRKYVPMSSASVELLNARTANNSWRFIYAPTKDAGLLQQVERYAKARTRAADIDVGDLADDHD